MKGKILIALAAAACAATPAAHAMVLNPRGTGQVLVFPYYTANGGNNTLIAVANTTGNGKAVKVRFHEGYDGRGVLDFDVYIPPHGEWNASVAARGGDSAPATLATGGTACTVPSFATVDFSDASYAGEDTFTGPTGNADGGPTTADRTREGHFDVFEMGEVTGNAHQSLAAITSVNGALANCALIEGAWSTGGYWQADPTADLSPPAGGLYGTEYIVDVADGTMYGIDAEAIDGFSDVVQNTAPGSPVPDLDSASAGADGLVEALVPANGVLLQLEYENPVDAVSALFMTGALHGDFIRDPSLGALTDWVVTAPTKRYYVDPVYVGQTAAAPFDKGFMQNYGGGQLTVGGVVTSEWGSSFPYACSNVGPIAYDRSGEFHPVGQMNDGGGVCNAGDVCPGSPNSNVSLMPCLETSVLTFSTQLDPTNFAQPLSAFGSRLLDATDPGNHVSRVFDNGVDLLPPDGSMTLDLTVDAAGNAIASRKLTPAANGDVLAGLPVIAFAATRFVNASVTPGVLANYSGSTAIRGSVGCNNAEGVSGACR